MFVISKNVLDELFGITKIDGCQCLGLLPCMYEEVCQTDGFTLFVFVS
jgi:hypothetical protein